MYGHRHQDLSEDLDLKLPVHRQRSSNVDSLMKASPEKRSGLLRAHGYNAPSAEKSEGGSLRTAGTHMQTSVKLEYPIFHLCLVPYLLHGLMV